MQQVLNKTVQNYVLLQKIGEGQFGNVYRAENKKNRQTYAIKTMNISKFKQTPKLSQFTNNEIAILSKINHPNIIRFIEMLRTANNYYLVYELCNGGTLSDYIRQRKFLPEGQALGIFAQIRSAFEILSKSNILHRDLKPTNILFHNNVIKLADFGFCKELLKEQDLTQTIVGSPIYMAPQVLKGQAYDNRADIWSMGVILYQMLYGVCPYQQCTIPRLISLLDNAPLKFNPKIPVSNHIKEYLKQILTLDPQHRISPNIFINYALVPPPSNKCLKYGRGAIFSMVDTIESLLSSQSVDLVLTFMVYKIYCYFSKELSLNSMIWDQFGQCLRPQSCLSKLIKEEQDMMRPVRDKLEEALSNSQILSVKIQLKTEFINVKYFLQCLTKMKQEKIKIKLYNCLLYYMHIIKLMEGKKVKLKVLNHQQKNLQMKEKQCLEMMNIK